MTTLEPYEMNLIHRVTHLETIRDELIAALRDLMNAYDWAGSEYESECAAWGRAQDAIAHAEHRS